MLLKVADTTDIPDLIRMSLSFKANSPYLDHATDTTKIEELITSIVSGSPTEGIALIVKVENTAVGMLIGISREFIFSRDKHATEIAWWVDKEHRKGPGKAMQEAFVFWAKKVGCKYLHMTLLQDTNTNKMKKLYKQLGFKQTESAWIKEI